MPSKDRHQRKPHNPLCTIQNRKTEKKPFHRNKVDDSHTQGVVHSNVTVFFPSGTISFLSCGVNDFENTDHSGLLYFG